MLSFYEDCWTLLNLSPSYYHHIGSPSCISKVHNAGIQSITYSCVTFEFEPRMPTSGMSHENIAAISSNSAHPLCSSMNLPVVYWRATGNLYPQRVVLKNGAGIAQYANSILTILSHINVVFSLICALEWLAAKKLMMDMVLQVGIVQTYVVIDIPRYNTETVTVNHG